MKPFFPFRGSKWKLVDRLPDPSGMVTEIYTGNAWYSTGKNVKNAVIIDDRESICSLWEYLISVKSKTIRNLPIPKPGMDIRDMKLCSEEIYLIRLHLDSNIVHKRTDKWTESIRDRISRNLENIRHWKIKYGTHTDSWASSTTFINGNIHKYGNNLRNWIINRPGFVIFFGSCNSFPWTKSFGDCGYWCRYSGGYDKSIGFRTNKQLNLFPGDINSEIKVGSFLFRQKGKKIKPSDNIVQVYEINTAVIKTYDSSGNIDFWERSTGRNISVEKGSECVDIKNYPIVGYGYDKISVVKRVNRGNGCLSCNRGVIVNGEIVRPYNDVYEFLLGGLTLHLCDSCFNRLKISMMMPSIENPELSADFIGNFNDLETLDAEAVKFFELVSDIDKINSDLKSEEEKIRRAKG